MAKTPGMGLLMRWCGRSGGACAVRGGGHTMGLVVTVALKSLSPLP
jgi:hypothetical protein